jgi:hypothetical protein
LPTSSGGLIFISCGQVAPEEIKLGNDICALVRELTPHEPYFAEQQPSLESFTKFILGNLDRSIALIVVIHPRGKVTYTDADGPHEKIRASVWIEQELAISAYITQIQNVPLTVRVYVKAGVAREGMRDKLPLSPVEFADESEVLTDLRNILPGWKKIPTSIRVTSPPKVSVKLLKGVPSDFLLSFTNRTGENAFIHEIRFMCDGKEFMEPWIPTTPHEWIVPTNPSRTIHKVLYGENPAMKLVSWNERNATFPADIDIIFECEVLGQIREVKNTLRVQVNVFSNSITQL